jgi:hypothetical protein
VASDASGRMAVVNGPNGVSPDSLFNKRVDVAVAEYNAIRAGMNQLTAGHAALTGLALTGLGVIFGFALDEKGDIRLLLAVPPIALFVSLPQAAELSRIAKLGDYIRVRLEPTLRTQVRANIPAWEQGVGTRREDPSRRIRYARLLLLDFPAAGILVVTSTAAQVLIAVRDDLDRVADGLWWAWWVWTVIVLCVPFVAVERIRINSAKAPVTHGQ